MFKKAERKKLKLRLALTGPTGGGKSYTALLLAKALGTKIGALDTEHESLDKYADIADFDRADSLADYHPMKYIEVVTAAAAAGYDVFVIDSLSHAWNGKGGVLEIVDKMGGNKFSNGWKAIAPVEKQLVETLLSYPGHIIATLRSKMAYEVEMNERGKAVPRKIGLQPIQRDQMEYEFDVVLALDGDARTITPTKTRCSALAGRVFRYEETLEIASILKNWLAGGVELPERDVLMQEIRFATSNEQLTKLLPRITVLTSEEKELLRISYAAKLEELKAAAAQTEGGAF